MIALILSGLLLGSAQQPHSAQCLIEVARMTGDDLDIRNDRMRQAAANKTDAMMQRHRELTIALQEYDQAHVAYAATIPTEISAGRLPPGSEQAIQDRMLRERGDLTSPMVAVVRTAPSCDWPALPVPPVAN